MRKPREDIDNYIEEALSKENDLSYSELKDVIEGDRYLDYRGKGEKLHDEIYNSSLKRLETSNRIDRHLCEDRSKGRICYSLTESRLQEMEIKLKENRATYFLIFFTELYEASPHTLLMMR